MASKRESSGKSKPSCSTDRPSQNIQCHSLAGKFKSAAPATTASAVPSFSLTGTAANQPASNPSSPFSFGGSQSQAQPQTTTAPASGGLFGQSQQQQQQPAAGGSLFGGGMFGAKPAQTAQPAAPSTSLFGQPQQSQPAQTSLFGQPQAQSQAPQTSSLFGQPQTQAQQPQQSQTSLFGQPQQQNQPQQQTSLFGQSQSQPQQQQQQQQPSLFGQSQSQQPQASTSSSGLSKTTKFSDLPENVQKNIEQVDSWIKTQKSQGGDTNVEGLGQAIWQTAGDVKSAKEEYSALSQALASLTSSLNALRSKFIAEEEDFRKIIEIWETYKSVDGRPGAVRVAAHRDFPQDFFSRAATAMEERVARYKKNIAQISRVMVSLSTSNDRTSESPQAIAQTIQNHQNALLTLAAQLELLQEKMIDLKEHYALEYREKTNSMRDPFEVAREEKGLPLRT
ncbi:nucleoporin p58/p45, partial [Tremellales sp. Uapishka_1]